MNIHNKGSLIEFYTKHPDRKDTLVKWYHDVSKKTWRKPNDVIKDYNKARTIKNDRAIFKINENDYRIIVELNYQKGWIFIKFIGTHAAYDKVDAERVDAYKKKKSEILKKDR